MIAGISSIFYHISKTFQKEHFLSKTFVLDTNVLLFDPQSIFKFQDHNVFVPLIVVEELDRFKKDQTENGRNARYFSRTMEA